MKFYTSKYPINYAYNNETKGPESLPVGTVLTIDGINGDCFDMKCVGKKDLATIIVGVNMLQFGFTETDNINL